MKFLVLNRRKPGYSPEHITPPTLREARQWIDRHIEDHTIEVAYNFPTHGGVAIIEVDSMERAMKLLHEYPLYPFLDTEIMPLVDYREAFDTSIHTAEKIVLTK